MNGERLIARARVLLGCGLAPGDAGRVLVEAGADPGEAWLAVVAARLLDG